MKKILEKFKDKKMILILTLVLVGCLLRIVAIDKFPIGLNCDEASSAYDAFCLLNHQIDRNGNFLPVYLKAWGSGQSVLYSYISMIFILIFGLNIISTRLPMAIIGCISLIVWYKLLKKIVDGRKFACVGLAFLCICPWHIMKSRWGMEANIFPDLVLWAVYYILTYLKDKKVYRIFLASAILGLTGYAYGTSYMFLPIFCIMLFIYLLKKKEISIKNAIISFCIIGIIALPIMLYVIINTFDLPQINLPFMTIPRLTVNRYEEQTGLFSGNILLNSIFNIKNSIMLIFLQNDNLAWNSISGIGMYYLVSIPFLIIGAIFSFKNTKYKFDYDSIFNIWFISAFLLLFVLNEANINRINILIFPLIYYIVKGLYIIYDVTSFKIQLVILSIFIINFILFIIYYTNMNINDYWTFTDGVKEPIEYVESSDAEKIYVQYSFKEPYIYVLYYTKTDAHNYIDTVQYINERGNFENIAGFGKYHFVHDLTLEEDKDNIYMMKKENIENIDTEKWDVVEFEKYIVVRLK